MEERRQPDRTRASRRREALRKARNRRIAALVLGACALALVVALVIILPDYLKQEETDDGLILKNVYVADIYLGGMTRSEAESALRLGIGDSFSTQDMVVRLPNDELVLTPADTQAYVDMEDLVDAAYNYGRSGTKLENKIIRQRAEKHKHYIALLDYMRLNTDNIRSIVEDFCANYNSVMTPTTITLNGNRPDYQDVLSGKIPLSSVQHQTLVITIGTPQFDLVPESLYAEVLDAFSTMTFRFSYTASISLAPEDLDVQALFDEYCSLPQDASIDGDTFVVTPEVYGYGFDMEEVSRMIQLADFGETISIPMGFLYPDITEQELGADFFRHLLASYVSIGDNSNENRNTNLQLACEAINGIIIKSGETFDFNKIVGPRTADDGYLSAPTYPGSNTETIGGGISQLSSAIHYCAIIAGLQVNESHTHTYAVSYSPFGTDAYVAYGTDNLVFTNTTSDPLMIFASFNSGNVNIRITGTNEQRYQLRVEYEILETLHPETLYQYMTKDNVYGYEDGYQIQSGITGYIVDVYCCQYDASGDMVSRQLIGTYTYSRRNEIIVQLEQDGDSPAEPPNDDGHFRE